MSPHVFLAALAQETNAFAPLPTGAGGFTGRFVTATGRAARGSPPFPEALQESLQRHESDGRLQLTVGPVAGAHPGGLVVRRTYELLRDQILSELAAARPVDIVALHLHGAMMADGYPDCEGDLLSRIREVVGMKAVVGALLDPHAHLSDRMLEAADLLIAYKEYPHTDFRERAEELTTLLLATHQGDVTPCSALWDSGVIGVFHTNLPEVRDLVDRMHRWESTHQALTASLIHGFPWGDTPDMGTRALVICDRDLEQADGLAAELAAAAQTLAIRAPVRTVRLEDALRALGQQSAASPEVWADCADNPGGGAAGDSTFVLDALLQHNVSNACLGPLWDPAVVDIAFEAGVGARLDVRVGGKSGRHSGAPIDARVEVLALNASASQTFAGARFPLGRAAALRCAGIELVVASERDQARGTDLFTNLGIPCEERRLIVVKSSQHFQESFARIASRIVYLDCPGTLQLDLASYAYERLTRPRWPLDPVPPSPWRVATRGRRT